MRHVLIITGMSGAGRSQFGNHLEDLGWYVIDNLPPSLLETVVDITVDAERGYDRIALAVGAGAARELETAITELKAKGHKIDLVFLDANDETLVRRYESTKRTHPHLVGETLAEAIQRERVDLASLRTSADLVIDTTGLTPYALKKRVEELYSDEPVGDSMRTRIMSFGYKHGMPPDVDIVMDCRFLANPYWVEELRSLTGQDPEIVDYLFQQPDTEPFLERLLNLLELLIPAYRAEGKSYLTIALGCTGGRHRSVAMAENVSARLGVAGVATRVYHRDIER